MPKGFSEHEKEIINQQLLDQGCKLFSTYGLKKTNVEEIAKAAGISKGAFYIFYESKEALFMEVIEQVEIRMRKDILTAIDLPGSSPRARLLALLKRAFDIFKTNPILKIFTGNDYSYVFRKIPINKIQEHMASDQVFINELVTHCQNAGIPIQAKPEQIISLLYPLVIGMLHEDDLARTNMFSNIDTLLELIAAYSLGEIKLQSES